MDIKKFYRAMHVREYELYEVCGIVDSKKEWVEPELESKSGIKLSLIKSWVDNGYSEKDLHQLIVCVEGEVDTEFSLRPLYFPPRYENIKMIDFERLKVVHDPRAVVSSEPVLLEDKLGDLKWIKNYIIKWRSL